MARIYGLNGVLRGRQGNNVFSVQNGTQVVRAYQPVVSNPRSIAQQVQRTKFALAGRMSAATPLLAIAGLEGSNPRAKRARFVQLVTNSAAVTTVDGSLRASVLLADVAYSEGNVAQYTTPPTITAVWGTGTQGQYYVLVTYSRGFLSTDAPEGYGEILVVALYDAVTGRLDEVQAVERVMGGDQATFTLNFRQGAQRNVYVAAYICPFIRDTRTASMVTSFLGGSETEAFINSSVAARLSNARWGQSVFVTSIGVLGGTQQSAIAPVDDNRHVTDPDNGDVMKDSKK